MDQEFQASVDELGRILIPAPIRKHLHLSPGMTLVVEKGEQEDVRLRLQTVETTLIEKDGILVAKVTSSGDLSNVVRHERDRRIFDLLQRVDL